MWDHSDVELVEDYIAAAQLARETQDPEDLDRLRTFLADDITIKMASPWTDEPWRLVIAGVDALIERFTAPINQGSSLRTENVNVVAAGEDVVVEQLSTVSREGSDHVSMVCHIFTVSDGLIRGIRAYRNDAGIPPG